MLHLVVNPTHMRPVGAPAKISASVRKTSRANVRVQAININIISEIAEKAPGSVDAPVGAIIGG